MSSAVEWSIRSKIADIQIFLTSSKCTEADLTELDGRLDSVLEIVNEAKARKVGGEPCGKS